MVTKNIYESRGRATLSMFFVFLTGLYHFDKLFDSTSEVLVFFRVWRWKEIINLGEIFNLLNHNLIHLPIQNICYISISVITHFLSVFVPTHNNRTVSNRYFDSRYMLWYMNEFFIVSLNPFYICLIVIINKL